MYRYLLIFFLTLTKDVFDKVLVQRQGVHRHVPLHALWLLDDQVAADEALVLNLEAENKQKVIHISLKNTISSFSSHCIYHNFGAKFLITHSLIHTLTRA